MTEKTIIRLSSNPDGFGKTPDDLSKDMFASALPTQHSYEYYADDDVGLYVGVWDTNDMTEASAPYSCDEFMWLIEGQAQIKNNRTGVMETAKAGESFVIPRGYDCQWHQEGYLRKFYVIWEDPIEPIPEAPSHEGIIIPRVNAPLSTMKTSAPFLVTAGAKCKENICYTDTTDKFLAGTWQSDAFESEERPFPYNEFFYVQSGTIRITDNTGTNHVFTAGDALFIPEGTICSASADDTVTMFFTIVRTLTQ